MKTTLTSLLLFIAISIFAQRGIVVEGQKVDSKILGYSVNYSVYLPHDYYTSKRLYPVLYLLHGYSDNETAWVQYGQVHYAFDKLLAAGDVTEMIIVMPDGKITWYQNSFDGKTRFEDMFFQEFIPTVEKNYRITADKAHRSISGLSMGGYGSLMYSLKYPEMFTSCVAFSAAVFTEEECIPRTSKNEYVYATVYGPLVEGKMPEYWHKNNVLDLIKGKSKKEIEQVRYYFDCGDKDFIYKGLSELFVTMRSKDVYFENRMRAGWHNWEYWRTGIYDGLKFISQGFAH